jgi:SAM-dependent methyltransferase
MQMSDSPDYASAVTAEWTDERTVAGWRRWHVKAVGHLAPMSDALLEGVAISPGEQVLDLASGSGEPAHSIASLVGERGGVTATDLSQAMIALAESHGEHLSNVSYRQADAHALPFPDASFDAVTSRLGIMYFWDCPRALDEVLRVLKPGGRVGFVAWAGPPQNALARTLIGPFASRRPPPAPPADAPQPFRFAAPGSLANALERAGFVSVDEQHREVPCPWPGPPEEMWQQLYDLAVPLQPYIDSFAADEREAAVAEVIAAFSECYDGTHTDPTAGINLVHARKPAAPD